MQQIHIDVTLTDWHVYWDNTIYEYLKDTVFNVYLSNIQSVYLVYINRVQLLCNNRWWVKNKLHFKALNTNKRFTNQHLKTGGNCYFPAGFFSNNIFIWATRRQCYVEDGILEHNPKISNRIFKINMDTTLRHHQYPHSSITNLTFSKPRFM